MVQVNKNQHLISMLHRAADGKRRWFWTTFQIELINIDFFLPVPERCK